MFGIGVQELGVILVLALLVFGPKRMPELARMLGRGLGEFRRASNDLRQSLALDEIQHELRRDLQGAGTIHRPESDPARPGVDRSQNPPEPDRPAQAGDDLPDPPRPNEARDPNGTTSGESGSNASDRGGPRRCAADAPSR